MYQIVANKRTREYNTTETDEREVCEVWNV